MKKKRIVAITIAFITIITAAIEASANEHEVKVGGFIKVNASLSNKGVNGIDDASGTYNKHDTRLGPIKAYVEGNFGVESNADGNRVEAYGTYNSRFVLRHAYVEVGNFLIGQTISTFVDPKGFLDILDYGGNSATVFARQPQIRFTVKHNKFTLITAVENPTSNLGDYDVTDDQRIPDFVGRIDYDPAWGHISLAGIVRELRIDNGDFEAHKITGGFIVTANVYVLPGKVELTAQYLRGGIGHYGAFSAFADGIVLDDGAGGKMIDPLNIQGVTFGGTVWFSDNIRSTIVGSWAENIDIGHNQQTLGTGHAIENVKSLHANIFYDLMDNFMLGFEYKKLIGELSDATKPNVDRFQLSMIYGF